MSNEPVSKREQTPLAGEASALARTGWKSWAGRLKRWIAENPVAVLLAVAALLLYVPGIWWGLPTATSAQRVRPWGADELGPLGPVAELYSVFLDPSPRFNPQYPLFHYFIQAIFCAPYIAWLKLTGGMGRPSGVFPFGLRDPIHSIRVVYLFSRIPSLLMAAGTVIVAFETARKLWGRRAALLSAMFVMLMYPMYFYARTGHVDIGALFWTSLGLYVFAASLRDGFTVRRAIWLGIWAACAAGTKDATYALFAGVGLALLLVHFGRGRRTDQTITEWLTAPIAGLLSGAVAYSITSGLIFRPARWLRHAHYITQGPGNANSYYSTPASVEGYEHLIGETLGHFASALTMPIALAGVAGLVLAWRRNKKDALLALPILTYIAGVILPVRFVRFRFVFFPAYTVALLAGFTFAIALASQRVVVRRAAQLATAAVLVWSLLRGVDLTNQMLGDSRYALGEWLAARALPNDRIAHHGLSWKLPALPASVTTVNPDSCDFNSHELADLPEWFVVMPYQEFEGDHEFTMTDEVYSDLASGRLPYTLALKHEPKTLFRHRPVSWVNPPYEVYVRKDLASRLRGVSLE